MTNLTMLDVTVYFGNKRKTNAVKHPDTDGESVRCMPHCFVNVATIAQNAEKPDRTNPKKHSLRECVLLFRLLMPPENAICYKNNGKK
ncbi:hypothetical protein [Erwinia sp. CGal63]|uniref:hypothetical protein n=1 Tax=Erwinia sp. CGal63 TaxID=2919889 RepID=UPI00300ACBC5